MTKSTDRAILIEAAREVLEPIAARIGRLEKAAAAAQAQREAVRKQQLDHLARRVIAAHDQLVEKQLAAGVRSTRPVHKAGMTLAERLAEIAGEAAVAKRTNGTWRGIM